MRSRQDHKAHCTYMLSAYLSWRRGIYGTALYWKALYGCNRQCKSYKNHVYFAW